MWWHYSETIPILPFSVINKTWPQFCSLVCVCAPLSICPSGVRMCGRGGTIEEEWQKDMEGKTLILSGRVSRWVHSGESSANGCKMHNSVVTEGDGGSSEKRNKAREREGDRSERGALRKKGGRKSERRKKAGGREVSRQTEGDGTDMAGGGGHSGRCFIICWGIVRPPVNSHWASRGSNLLHN